MAEVTVSKIIDDLRVAEEVLRKFERRYWITSEQFYNLYSQGVLDSGEHAEDFSEWAGFYKLRLRREAAFRKIGQNRLQRMKALTRPGIIRLDPQEPAVEAI